MMLDIYIYIYVETEPAVKRNQDVLNYLLSESYLIKTDGKKNQITQLPSLKYVYFTNIGKLFC